MYVNSINISNFRTFEQTSIKFVHPDQDYSALGLPVPEIKNINLVLGTNGSGKTTLLKAIAIAALGPAVTAAGLPIFRLIRRAPGDLGAKSTGTSATITASFTTHHQDDLQSLPPPYILESSASIVRKGDVELPQWDSTDDTPWHPIFSNASDAFFFVGYGATRRVESKDIFDPGARQTNSLVRAQRIRSLFEEAYSLTPLSTWLPQLQLSNHGRFTQVLHLINVLLQGTEYEFTGEQDEGEYLFIRQGLSVPFPALSDGYRAYLGWIGDLLYHICQTCPSGSKLIENRGLVMVDEIDLHLHPAWQMTVLPTLSSALPNVQFVVTSHSPLVVGSMEWMNILYMAQLEGGASEARRMEWAIHGLDADQVLLTEFFGLDSTRAEGTGRELKALGLAASTGDKAAARRLMEAMSKGAEVQR